ARKAFKDILFLEDEEGKVVSQNLELAEEMKELAAKRSASAGVLQSQLAGLDQPTKLIELDAKGVVDLIEGLAQQAEVQRSNAVGVVQQDLQTIRQLSVVLLQSDV